jgi:hypothetical protein
VIYVPAKTGDYCFVACVASALLEDNGYAKLQDLIVDRFPAELRKGTPQAGVPTNWDDLEAVIRGLNLAASAERKDVSADDAKDILLKNKHMARWIFIETDPTGTHCVRVREISDDGISVMDPADSEPQWDWAEFKAKYRSLVLIHGSLPLIPRGERSGLLMHIDRKWRK